MCGMFSSFQFAPDLGAAQCRIGRVTDTADRLQLAAVLFPSDNPRRIQQNMKVIREAPEKRRGY